jgi:hypothetical protein
MTDIDDLVFRALKQRKKVTLFLCNDEEGGFGIKVDGKILTRNLPWESLEVEIDDN